MTARGADGLLSVGSIASGEAVVPRGIAGLFACFGFVLTVGFPVAAQRALRNGAVRWVRRMAVALGGSALLTSAVAATTWDSDPGGAAVSTVLMLATAALAFTVVHLLGNGPGAIWLDRRRHVVASGTRAGSPSPGD